jgi:hypothetical protein
VHKGRDLRQRPDREAVATPSAEAPRPVILNVGITGHRAGVLTAPVVRTLRPIVYTVFRELQQAALRLQETEDRLCSATPARLLLNTALATGADQLAAICGRSSGYFVRAILPFEAREYRKDFAAGDEIDGFEQALQAADEIVALPGDRGDPEAAYVLVGEALVENADILIAIWDGEEGRGAGGTAHVVDMAIRSSTPVIHIDIDEGSDVVRIRALTDPDEAAPFGTSLRDPELYGAVLRRAFKLQSSEQRDAAPAPATAGAAGR